MSPPRKVKVRKRRFQVLSGPAPVVRPSVGGCRARDVIRMSSVDNMTMADIREEAEQGNPRARAFLQSVGG